MIIITCPVSFLLSVCLLLCFCINTTDRGDNEQYSAPARIGRRDGRVSLYNPTDVFDLSMFNILALS